ncbi:MAG: DnaA/Hda family protein [Candidatus Thermoplasmatota archaeon]|nr:DnaA/Hda family protein [Candidatus Thermoplasmatota archaeon]
MTTRSNLKDAMERSRRYLGQSQREETTADVKSTLLDHISIRARARAEAKFAERFDLPQDAPSPLERLSILGGGSDYGDIVQSRLEAMRERISDSSPMDIGSEISDISPDIPRWVVGEDAGDSIDPVIPLWREVLDQHRKISPSEPLDESELGSSQVGVKGPFPSSDNSGYWPPYLTERPEFDFTRWQEGPSNRIATQAASEVIDYPGRRLNPLLIHGKAGSGKSHLLWAIGESLHAGISDRDVRLITAETFPEHLPDGWDDLLLHASSLLIDDADRIVMRPGAVENLAKVVGWAIDVGAQVVMTASRRLASDSLPIGRLRQAVSAGVHVELGPPSEDTMLLMLRRNTLYRGVSITDPQLHVIVGRSRGEWSRAKADFETVCLAIESGASLFGSTDVQTLLSGEQPVLLDAPKDEAMDSDARGAQIVAEALDSVMPESVEYRAEIITNKMETEDDYEPPEITLSSSAVAAENVVKDTLNDHLREIGRRGDDSRLTNRIPLGENIEALTDSALNRLESILHEHRFELSELNREIENISGRVENASSDELVSFTDRMLAIEKHLDKLQELGSGEYASEIEDFDPGELIKPAKIPVLIPDYSEPAKAILWPLKRRVLLPAED